MLAENSNYCLKNETEYQEQDPEELSETQTGLSNLQVQGRGARHGRAVNSQGQFLRSQKIRKKLSPRTISHKAYLIPVLVELKQNTGRWNKKGLDLDNL